MAGLANDTAVEPRRCTHRARGAQRSEATRVSPCAVCKPGQAGWRDRQTHGLPPMSDPCPMHHLWWVEADQPLKVGCDVFVVMAVQAASVAEPTWRAMTLVQPWHRLVRCSPWAIKPWCSWQVSNGMQFTPAWC